MKLPQRGRSRFRRVVVALLAVVLLPTVPAAALTFVGGWSITTKLKNAPLPVVTTTDTPAGGTTLTVDFGTFTAGPSGYARVRASRAFFFDAGETRVSSREAVRNFLDDADAGYRVKISKGTITVTIKLKKTAAGQWVNASPYSFTFTGI
jgi:hypothetical protein